MIKSLSSAHCSSLTLCILHVSRGSLSIARYKMSFNVPRLVSFLFESCVPSSTLLMCSLHCSALSATVQEGAEVGGALILKHRKVKGDGVLHPCYLLSTGATLNSAQNWNMLNWRVQHIASYVNRHSNYLNEPRHLHVMGKREQWYVP